MRQTRRNLITHSGGFFKVFFDISWQLSVKKFVVFFILFFISTPLHAVITAKSYVVGKGSPFNTGYLLEADASDPSGAKAKSTSYTINGILNALANKLDVPDVDPQYRDNHPASNIQIVYWDKSLSPATTSSIPVKNNVIWTGSDATNYLAVVKEDAGPYKEYGLGSSGVTIGQIYGTGAGMLTLPAGGYTLPAATTSALGGLKLKQAAASVGTNGSGINTAGTTAGRYYPLNITADNKVAYVNVPWTDTTYTAGTGISISGGVISATGGGSSFSDCNPDWNPVISMSFSTVECHQSGIVETVTFRFSPENPVAQNCGNDWTQPCPGTFIYEFTGGDIGNVDSDDPSRHNSGNVKICTFSMAVESNYGTIGPGIYEPGVMFLGTDPKGGGTGLFYRSGVVAGTTNDYGLIPPSTITVDCTFVIRHPR